MKVKIINTKRMFSDENDEEFDKVGIKVGDIIEVRRLFGNAVVYEYGDKECLFIYNFNIEEVK